MFNKTKFKASVVLAGKTTSDVAKVLGINESTLYRKISKDGEFTRSEIQMLIDFLSIENPNDIFLPINLRKCK